MLEILITIGIYFGIIVLALAILYFLCRTFWARTIITIVGAIAAMIAFFVMDDKFICGGLYFITYFFLFGKLVGKKTGEYDVEHKIDLDSRTVSTTKTARTHTVGNIVLSVVLAVASYYLSTLHIAVAIALPLLIVFLKVLRIRSHIRYRETEIDSYDSDSDPDSQYHSTNF